MANVIWSGTDANLKISLTEYGLLVADKPDACGDYPLVYKYSEDWYCHGEISHKDANEKAKRLGASFFSYCDTEESQWENLPIEQKAFDLMQYEGTENIFGSPYPALTEKEAFEYCEIQG